VPMRTPPGTIGRVSPGTVFLFTVMLHASITVCVSCRVVSWSFNK
jgi:hypothetical protein